MQNMRKKLHIYTVTIVLLVLGELCDSQAAHGVISETAGIFIREMILIFLWVWWLLSLKERILKDEIRLHFFCIAVLILVAIILDCIKHHMSLFFTPDSIALADEFSSYFSYILLEYVLLFMVFLACYIGEGDNYHLSWKWKMLCVPAIIINIIDLTNPIHGFIFTHDSQGRYVYHLGYTIAVIWGLFEIACFFIIVYQKNRGPHRIKRILRTLLATFPAAIYALGLVINFDLFEYFVPYETFIFSIATVSILELVMNTGLVPNNRNYEDLFVCSTISMMITDKNYETILSSRFDTSFTEQYSRKEEKNVQRMNHAAKGRRKMSIFSRNIVKEAIDNLPSGICFFDKNGLAVLCNRQMYSLLFDMTGRELQIEEDIIQAMKNLENDTYISKDNNIWLFTNEQVVDKYGTEYREYLATNTTKLHQTIEELEQKQKELSKLMQNMEQINKDVVSTVREEEILSARMKVHNDMGGSILRTKQYYLGSHDPKEKADLIERWKKTLSHLRGDQEEETDTDSFEELKYVVSTIGAEIVLDGEIPKDKETEYLIVSAMRESMTNLIRHAKGKKLFVKITYNDNVLTAEFRNDGEAPKNKIVEGGGLSTLRSQIERNGGMMHIQSVPEFVMTINIPLPYYFEGDRIL